MISNTRSLIESLNSHNREKKETKLEKVSATKSLLICSMPCEEKAAQITNETVANMEAGETIKVARRFLQTREGRNNTLLEAGVSGIITFLLYRDISKNPNSPLAFLFIFYFLNMLPNISNTLRYGKTQISCENWLIKKIGDKKFNQIEKLEYDHPRMFQKLNSILTLENNHSELELILEKQEHRSFCTIL